MISLQVICISSSLLLCGIVFILSIIDYIILSKQLTTTDLPSNSKQQSYIHSRNITLAIMILSLLALLGFGIYIYFIWNTLNKEDINHFLGVKDTCNVTSCEGSGDIVIKK